MTATEDVALDDLFARIDASGLKVCVMRGYESLPGSVENDLDLMIHPRDAPSLRSLLLDFAAAKALELVAVADHFHVTLIRFLGEGETGGACRLIIDEHVRGEGWWGIPYLSTEQILDGARRQGSFWIPRPAHEAAMALLSHLLIGKRVKEKHLVRLPTLISDDGDEFSRILRDAFGPRLARRVSDAIENQDRAALDRLAWPLRLRLLISGLLTAPSRARDVVRDRMAQVRLKTSRRGLVVVVDRGSAVKVAAELARSVRLVFKDAWFVGSAISGADTNVGFGRWFADAGTLAAIYRVWSGVVRERVVFVTSAPAGRRGRRFLDAGADPDKAMRLLIQTLAGRVECNPARFVSMELNER